MASMHELLKAKIGPKAKKTVADKVQAKELAPAPAPAPNAKPAKAKKTAKKE